MKAVLVMDMPDSCDKCPLFCGAYTDMCCRGLQNRGINYPYPEDFRQDWCPLKEIPEKQTRDYPEYDRYISGWDDGWDACIDEILGE